ncbi:hypothetical protein B0H19DRAFT_1086070 [Mycena capillaripes]|nr:hypothetical protein B0H19DRAFT_1086070 [Mycena capillaripes]
MCRSMGMYLTRILRLNSWEEVCSSQQTWLPSSTRAQQRGNSGKQLFIMLLPDRVIEDPSGSERKQGRYLSIKGKLRVFLKQGSLWQKNMNDFATNHLYLRGASGAFVIEVAIEPEMGILRKDPQNTARFSPPWRFGSICRDRTGDGYLAERLQKLTCRTPGEKNQ